MRGSPKMPLVQESFHVVSGMYPLAETCVVGSLLEFQYVCGLKKSLKSVPPTATLNGVEAMPLTANPDCAGCGTNPRLRSQPGEPLSPLEMNTVIPWVAACSQSSAKNWLPEVPKSSSHAP